MVPVSTKLLKLCADDLTLVKHDHHKSFASYANVHEPLRKEFIAFYKSALSEGKSLLKPLQLLEQQLRHEQNLLIHLRRFKSLMIMRLVTALLIVTFSRHTTLLTHTHSYSHLDQAFLAIGLMSPPLLMWIYYRKQPRSWFLQVHHLSTEGRQWLQSCFQTDTSTSTHPQRLTGLFDATGYYEQIRAIADEKNTQLKNELKRYLAWLPILDFVSMGIPIALVMLYPTLEILYLG